VTECRYCQHPATKGRCHGNEFWDCISCKWTLVEVRHEALCKGWFVFSQPLRLLVALSGFVVVAIGTAPGGRLLGWELTR